MIRIVLLLLLVFGSIISGGALWSGGQQFLAVAFVLLCAAWIAAILGKIRWFSHLSLVVMCFILGLGALLSKTSTPVLASAAILLAAWDLTGLYFRTLEVENDSKFTRFQLRYFARLGMVILAGLGLALLSREIHLLLEFWPAVLLVIVSATGILLTLSWLRRQTTIQ